jgi:hypothetical protein
MCPEPRAGARRLTKPLRLLASVASFVLPLASANVAHAQACCAGSSAVTPARLALHEDWLVGTTLHEGGVLGSYDARGTYTAQPPHTSEVDFEEDLLAAVRVTKRGQLALLVPFVQTYRTIPGASEAGGGIGDVNIGARYDFVLAGESKYIPGVALLAGLTLPTGRPVEASSQPLATDATGVGAFQGNVGVALEQTWGSWLVNVSGLLAQRAARSTRGVHETLGTQLTGLGAVAYTFTNEAAFGIVASYAAEGDAQINGATATDSSKRALTLSAVGLYPLTDALRLQGSLFILPPLSSLGTNQNATTGLTLTVLLGFS